MFLILQSCYWKLKCPQPSKYKHSRFLLIALFCESSFLKRFSLVVRNDVSFCNTFSKLHFCFFCLSKLIVLVYFLKIFLWFCCKVWLLLMSSSARTLFLCILTNIFNSCFYFLKICTNILYFGYTGNTEKTRLFERTSCRF